MRDRSMGSTGGTPAIHSGRVAQDNGGPPIFHEAADVICDSIIAMVADPEPLPDDIDALKAELAAARARASADQAVIAHQQL